MIQYLKEPIYVDYIVSYNKVIRIKTHIIPIIIDYGKSHVFYENEHHGFINIFKFSTSNDILTILITSIYQIIICKRLSKNDFTYLLKLSNFISNTSFCKQTFKNSKDIKNFFYNAKKYTNLVFSDKYELEKLTPLDLFDYINKFNYNLPFEYVFEYNSIMNKDNPVQIFEYILSNNNSDRLKSFTKLFDYIDTFINDTILDITMLYVLTELEINLYSVYNSMLYFLKNENMIINKYENKFIKAIINIKKKYNNIQSNINTELDILDFNTVNYTEDIFLFPEEVKSEMDKNKHIDTDKINCIINFKNIIEKLLLNKKIIQCKDYINIVKIDNNKINNNLANLKTLRLISEKILFF